jgi:hypothetical protein
MKPPLPLAVMFVPFAVMFVPLAIMLVPLLLSSSPGNGSIGTGGTPIPVVVPSVPPGPLGSVVGGFAGFGGCDHGVSSGGGGV